MRATFGLLGLLGLTLLLSSFACGAPDPSKGRVSFLPPGQRTTTRTDRTTKDAGSRTDRHNPDQRETPDTEFKDTEFKDTSTAPDLSQRTEKRPPERRTTQDEAVSPDRRVPPEQRPPTPQRQSWIGEPCRNDQDCAYNNARCLRQSDGYPEGQCTAPCTTRCPDQPGKPITFCVPSTRIAGHTGMCVSRCDTSAYPQGGCRRGYFCKEANRNTEPQTKRQVCVPGQAPPAQGCYAQLTKLGVNFIKAKDPNKLPKDGGTKRCSIQEPLKLQPPVLGVDWVYTSNGKRYDMLMSCQLALRLVQLSRYLKSRGITKAQHVGTYNCRRIRTDNGPSQNLSHHSYGNAIDISGFFDSQGKLYSLVKHWDHSSTWRDAKRRMGCWSTRFNSPEAKLLYEVACQMWKQKMFSLLLTPNYNRAHDNHFHADLSSNGRVLSTQTRPPYIGKHDALGH